MHLYNYRKPEATEALYALASGPHICAKKYTGCIINGVRFHTKARDSRLRTQNSGIVVEGNHKDEFIDFYGVLIDIIELDYIKGRSVVLFKCKWFNLGDKRKGMHIDGKFTSVNVNRFWYENDPFVLACQAKQVFYLNDTILGNNWQIVQKFNHRHVYDVKEFEDELVDIAESQNCTNKVYQEIDSNDIDVITDIVANEIPPLHRDDVDPNIVDGNVVQNMMEEHVDAFLANDHDEEDCTLIEYVTDEDDELDIDDDIDIGDD